MKHIPRTFAMLVLPVTLIAAMVALVLSRPVTLIETQRSRDPEPSLAP